MAQCNRKRTTMFIVYALGCLALAKTDDAFDEKAALEFINTYEKNAPVEMFKLMKAVWKYTTNLTNETDKLVVEAKTEYGRFEKNHWKTVKKFRWENFLDSTLKRKCQVLSILGYSALEDDEFQMLTNTIKTMRRIYSTTTVCSYSDPSKCDLRLEPELRKIFFNSRDERELLYSWREWHDKAGKPLRPLYATFVKYANKASLLNGFEDRGAMLRSAYSSSTLLDDLEEIWEQVKPLYLQLHAYVRRRLYNFYGTTLVNPNCPIPAHLLGSVWGGMWSAIRNLTSPFPDRVKVDITQEMLRQNYTVVKMFEMAEEFFISLGFEPLSSSFWDNSMLERPPDREVMCHASAFNFKDGENFRIKMCTEVNVEDFFTVHHEMGHIQYFMQYRDQPYLFQEGANPGFHEAVGDTLVLSVSTLAHLRSVGLRNSGNSPEDEIDQLLALALDSVAVLPFGYLVDLWQWDVFRERINEDNYNENWWKLRLELQGIAPPIHRNDDYFDPGTLFHISNGSPYIMYFVAGIIQFQFHKGLCEEAGKYISGDPLKPLHKCDIYNSKSAGKLLRKALRLGSSKPWPEVMNIITRGRTSKMDAAPLLEYFQPLFEFLVKENERTQETIGWIDCTSRSNSDRNNKEFTMTFLIVNFIVSYIKF